MLHVANHLSSDSTQQRGVTNSPKKRTDFEIFTKFKGFHGFRLRSKISQFKISICKAIQNQEQTFKSVFTKLVQIMKPYKTNFKVVFLKVVKIVKPYKTRSNLLSSVYKGSANRETIQNQEQSFNLVFTKIVKPYKTRSNLLK